jgi:hypothetical protein
LSLVIAVIPSKFDDLARHSPPHRQLGGSPLSQHIQNNSPNSTRRYPSKYRGLLGSRTKAPPPDSTKKTAKTIQPCQALGMPHPHPYRLAGNHYLGSVDMVVLHGAYAPLDMRLAGSL